MLIDFDPTVEDVLMPAELAMKFMNGEPCPFSEESLNEIFGTRK